MSQGRWLGYGLVALFGIRAAMVFPMESDQRPPARLNLPTWACAVAHEKGLDERYAVYDRINPFFLTGDFDGDHKTDARLTSQH